MVIWSRIIAEKFRIIFKVCVLTDKRGGGQANVGSCGQGGRDGPKIPENVRKFFMDSPFADSTHYCAIIYWLLLTVNFL